MVAMNRGPSGSTIANASRRDAIDRIKAAHAAAIKAGLVYDKASHSYKDTKWSGYRAESYKAGMLHKER